ncbi:hypothetical protein G9A89_010213 [Geosiphon pyriformis]|nr:hypothetical protein G9A89_010213 [Geosiphon pyriformis]
MPGGDFFDNQVLSKAWGLTVENLSVGHTEYLKCCGFFKENSNAIISIFQIMDSFRKIFPRADQHCMYLFDTMIGRWSERGVMRFHSTWSNIGNFRNFGKLSSCNNNIHVL